MLGIAVDIDGTLVDMDGCLFPATAKTLAEHWSRACVILASARPAQGIQCLLEQLGQDGPFIALNGGLISLGKGQKLLEGNLISPEVLGAVFDIALSEHSISALFVYDAEHWYAWGDGSSISQEMALTSATPVIIQDLTPLRSAYAIKLLATCTTEPAWMQIYDLLKERTGKKCTIRQSRPYYVEITDLGVTKGAALKTCRRLFNLEKCIAIGDGLNDLDMFLSADISYAAPAAPPELKMQATYVLDPPHDKSLSRLFYRLLTAKET